VVATISLREELIFLLTQATELEHSLCCSYLFTGFSLKSSVEDGLTPETVEVVKGWKGTFTHIAIEEMFHLTLINDLLVGIGSAPNFDRSNFPHGCSYYMPDLHIELHPFSEETLRHFVAIEQPTTGDLPLRQNPALDRGVQGDMHNDIGPDPHLLDSQGDVYDIALRGIRAMAERIGEGNVFIGPKASTAITRFLESSSWEPIRSVAAAEKAFARIIEEGEGGEVAGENSHHHLFAKMLDEYLAIKAKDPSFEPAFPVLENPFSRTPPEASGPVNLIDDDLAVKVSDLFNEVYVAMLHLLNRFLVASEETDEEAGKLMNIAMNVMGRSLAPLGELLVRLPAGTLQPGKTAGPSFVVGHIHPLHSKPAAWYVLHERFGELAAYTDQLAAEAGEHGPALGGVSKSLSRIVRMLG
jgi:hypothetical protein